MGKVPEGTKEKEKGQENHEKKREGGAYVTRKWGSGLGDLSCLARTSPYAGGKRARCPGKKTLSIENLSKGQKGAWKSSSPRKGVSQQGGTKAGGSTGQLEMAGKTHKTKEKTKSPKRPEKIKGEMSILNNQPNFFRKKSEKQSSKLGGGGGGGKIIRKMEGS